MTRLVILGATGRVGRLLLAAFRGDVLPLTRHAPAPPGWLLWDPARPTPLPEGGMMLHLAGPTPSGAGGGFDASTDLALAGLRAARNAGMAHVFLASSAAVYGRPGDDTPLTEDAPCAPVNAYGAAKLAMESAALRFSDQGGPGLTLLRIGNVAGTDMLMRNAMSGMPLRLDRFADGRSPRRAYIGPETLARVLESLFAAKSLPQVLNIAAPTPGDQGVEMAALLRAFAHSFEWQEAPDGALPALPLSTTRLSSLHRFAPGDGDAAEMVAQWNRLRGCLPDHLPDRLPDRLRGRE